MKTYLDREVPIQVRRVGKEKQIIRTSRPGKEIIWEQVGVVRLGDFQISKVDFLCFNTALLVVSCVGRGRFVFYDHREGVVSKVRQCISRKQSLDSLVSCFETEARIELMKKIEKGKADFYCNLYHRPAKTKANREITVDEILKRVSL